ncbi:MAG: hypothetical protein WD598_09855 [Acidimicrobiia bacterium]
MRYLRVGFVLVVTLGCLSFVLPGPASGHAATVTGTVDCAPSGAFLITWTITNDFPLTMTADVSSPSLGLSTSSVSVAAATPPPLTSSTVTQTVPVGAAGQTVTLNVTARWPDPFVQQLSASALLDPPCQQPSTEVGGISVTQPVIAGPQLTG